MDAPLKCGIVTRNGNTAVGARYGADDDLSGSITWLLKTEMRNDTSAIIDALYTFLDRTLGFKAVTRNGENGLANG
jgi:hypothetical protein